MAASRVLTVSVVTPEGSAYEGEAANLVVPAFDGEMAFFPMHAPLVGVLGYGELRVRRTDGEIEHFYLAGGVVEVADDVVSILAETVMPVSELDAADAEQRLADALAMEVSGDLEQEIRLSRMDDARARLRVAERARKRGRLTAHETLEQAVE